MSGIQYARASDRYTPDWFIFLLWGQFGNGASCEAILHFDMVCPLFCIGCLLCCGWFGNFWPDLIQHDIVQYTAISIVTSGMIYMLWGGIVQHSMVWYSRYGMVCCGSMSLLGLIW